MILTILAQPLNLALFILRNLQTKYFQVSADYTGKGTIDGAAVGGLAGWAMLSIIIALVIIMAFKYVLGEAKLSRVLARLFIGSIIYALLAIAIFAFINLGRMVLNEMDNVPGMRQPNAKQKFH